VSERRDPWEIPAVVAGMERQLARRRRLLAEGAEPLGWKLAFGTEAAMESLGLSGPLVGFLTDATLIASGGECDVGGWTAPKLEPEIAIQLGAGGTVAAIAPAIELADLDRPATETEPLLAGDIYHRGVVLGAPVARADPGALAVTVGCDEEEIAATADAEATVGRLDELPTYVAHYLERFGAESREGEVIISGSTVPLIDAEAGREYAVEVLGAGRVALRLGD
jgi:2-keto-4-pentenoate hydratase